MQNRYTKASIISSSIAILTGVLLLGISVTFGAPTYQPPGADVKPTFSGINVNGAVKISETNMAASPNNQVLPDATGGMLVLRNDPVNAPKKGIFMDGNDIVSLGQPLYLNSFGQQQVSIGSKDAPASLDIPGGYIRDSNNGGSPVTILGIKLPGANTDLDVASSSAITNSSVGLPVKISDPDGLSLSAGNLDMQNGVIKNSTGTNFGNVKIDDTLNVAEDANFLKDVDVQGNTNVTGKVTATGGFGTYTFRESGFVLVPRISHAYVALACNAGEIAVSCFSNAFSKNTGTDFWTNETFDDVILTALYPWTTKCEANYKNTSAVVDKYIKVGVMCLNPKI